MGISIDTKTIFISNQGPGDMVCIYILFHIIYTWFCCPSCVAMICFLLVKWNGNKTLFGLVLLQAFPLHYISTQEPFNHFIGADTAKWNGLQKETPPFKTDIYLNGSLLCELVEPCFIGNTIHKSSSKFPSLNHKTFLENQDPEQKTEVMVYLNYPSSWLRHIWKKLWLPKI